MGWYKGDERGGDKERLGLGEDYFLGDGRVYVPTLASITDHNASHTGSTCWVVALISTTRTMATMTMRAPREKMAATAIFWGRLICVVWRLWSWRRRRAITF